MTSTEQVENDLKAATLQGNDTARKKTKKVHRRVVRRPRLASRQPLSTAESAGGRWEERGREGAWRLMEVEIYMLGGMEAVLGGRGPRQTLQCRVVRALRRPTRGVTGTAMKAGAAATSGLPLVRRSARKLHAPPSHTPSSLPRPPHIPLIPL